MKRLLTTLVLVLMFSSVGAAQQVVDRMVATVNAGARTELITYSDLMWQLALQPATARHQEAMASLTQDGH